MVREREGEGESENGENGGEDGKQERKKQEEKERKWASPVQHLLFDFTRQSFFLGFPGARKR